MFTTYNATRYIVPLREGGSLPAVLDTDGGGHFVAKFRGAGQGARALVAELIVGGLAAGAGLPVPELAIIELDASFGRTEKDPEIQDILRGSRGPNVGLRYLVGAFNFDALADTGVEPDLAARIVWLDALTSNIDRTARNPNMLLWQGALWLIDHGAAMYFHHNWPAVDESTARAPFRPIRDHVLLSAAGDLRAADEVMRSAITEAFVDEVLAAVPDALYVDAPPGTTPPFTTAEENRDAYRRYFRLRLAEPRAFVDEAINAQSALSSPSRVSQPGGYRK